MARFGEPAWLACAASMALGAGELRGEGDPARHNGLAEQVARVFSPEMRSIEARLEQVGEELKSLPQLRKEALAERFGYRSDTLVDQGEAQWIQLDLGRRRTIDRIVAVPAHIADLGEQGEGYGFPLRFRIEVADEPEMQGAVTVVDHTAEDVANPGRFPMIFAIDRLEGRYVRFTSARHATVEGGFMWALEELLVLSGNSVLSGNKGPAEPQQQMASSSFELFPHWALARANDSQSALGLAVSREESPSLGYLSGSTENSLDEKWLMIDLGREYPVDEIRLVAVESDAFEVVGGRGYPRELLVELSDDPSFAGEAWRGRAGGGKLLGYPGGCADILQTSGFRARYLRVVARELWSREGQHVFALAEIQAYSGGENVALGKPVRVSDSTDKPPSSGWSPEFAVDGFSSRNRLIEYPQYLALIEQRRQLEGERTTLIARLDHKVRASSQLLSYGLGTFGAAAVLGSGWILARQRTARRRAVEQLREQIARDLHDEIGSNLGGIVLLSEMGSRHSADTQAREDFAIIRETAEETSQSMQDIVWLIGRGNMGLRDLVARMRRASEVILGDGAVSMSVEPAEYQDHRVSLGFRRQVFFAFKEVLHNVRKHARATAIEVGITVGDSGLRFEVEDDGIGFDSEQLTDLGNGLKNLKQRAECLGGSFHIDSIPGEGTSVTFEAPLNSDSI